MDGKVGVRSREWAPTRVIVKLTRQGETVKRCFGSLSGFGGRGDQRLAFPGGVKKAIAAGPSNGARKRLESVRAEPEGTASYPESVRFRVGFDWRRSSPSGMSKSSLSQACTISAPVTGGSEVPGDGWAGWSGSRVRIRGVASALLSGVSGKPLAFVGTGNGRGTTVIVGTATTPAAEWPEHRSS